MKTLKLKELKEGNIYKCLLSGRNVLAYHNEGSKQSEYACGETYHAFTGLIWDESECHYKQIELEDDVLVDLICRIILIHKQHLHCINLLLTMNKQNLHEQETPKS